MTLMLGPGIYTLQSLLDVYPRCQMVNIDTGQKVTLEEIQNELDPSGRDYPTVDHVRWDRIYLQYPDGDVIPLTAEGMKLSQERDKLTDEVADLQETIRDLNRKVEFAMVEPDPKTGLPRWLIPVGIGVFIGYFVARFRWTI